MGDTLQVKKSPKEYDAVIVGSGAGGGMAAYVLAKAGLKVCLLEAGPNYDPAINSSQLKQPWESPRVAPVPSSALLVILMPAIGDGKSMANHSPMHPATNGNGGGQEWWVAEPIMGKNFAPVWTKRFQALQY
jgi:choline dehydrogenase-like flavoprotein